MKILIIGCGSIGQRHIRNLIFLKAGKILAHDINEEKLNEVKKISSSIVVSKKLDNLWREKPKVALITVPTALHVKYALKAAKKDCHLFIEKPISHNLNRLNELIKIVKEKKLITFIGYNFRFNDYIKKIKDLLENKAIGRFIFARTYSGSYLPDRHPGEDYRSGYGARKSLGGGVILDALSHHLDYWIFLLGEPEEVFCFSDKRSNLEIDVEDIAEVLIKFSKGKIVSLHADFIQRPYKHTLEIVGEKGTIFCDFVNNFLKYYDIKKKKWRTHYSNKDHNISYVNELKYFIKCVKKHIQPTVDVVRGKKELAILTKIKKSNSVKKWIKI